MCRLYGLHANEPTKVECNLVRTQTARLRHNKADGSLHHVDGWGIGYFKSGHPIVERNAGTGDGDLHFGNTVASVYSPTVVAHVRAATVGVRGVHNCHPFRWGRWIFVHNGTLTAEPQLRSDLEIEMGEDFAGLIHGTTDSELVFHWLLSRLRRENVLDADQCLDPSNLRDLMADSVAELDRRNDLAGASRRADLNLLMTNGETFVAVRMGAPLYRANREAVHDCELCGVPHIEHDESVSYRAMVVASERLSREPWEEIPDGSVLLVDQGIHSQQVTFSRAAN